MRHSLELQTLAIRTGKIHVEHLLELPRSPVELFLDYEGVPDRDNHYLAVYQRVVLRLPYRLITQVTEHLFGIGLSASSGVNFLWYLASYYASTEEANLDAILKSDFVHVDETKINIQGVDHFVWVFTDGKHVVFRMTETREADIVREVLAGYQGKTRLQLLSLLHKPYAAKVLD